MKNTAIRLSYIVYYYNTQIYFVNKRIHNETVMGIVVSVSCSCTLQLLYISAITLHIPCYTFPTTVGSIIK